MKSNLQPVEKEQQADQSRVGDYAHSQTLQYFVDLLANERKQRFIERNRAGGNRGNAEKYETLKQSRELLNLDVDLDISPETEEIVAKLLNKYNVNTEISPSVEAVTVPAPKPEIVTEEGSVKDVQQARANIRTSGFALVADAEAGDLFAPVPAPTVKTDFSNGCDFSIFASMEQQPGQVMKWLALKNKMEEMYLKASQIGQPAPSEPKAKRVTAGGGAAKPQP